MLLKRMEFVDLKSVLKVYLLVIHAFPINLRSQISAYTESVNCAFKSISIGSDDYLRWRDSTTLNVHSSLIDLV